MCAPPLTKLFLHRACFFKSLAFKDIFRWLNLEPGIQSEVSQKEKNKYHILTHLYRIWKDGPDGRICRVRIEM